MDLNNLSGKANEAAAAAKAMAAKAAGNISIESAKEAISDGIESIKDKIAGEKSSLPEAAKEKIGDLLQKGADALEGLADKLNK